MKLEVTLVWVVHVKNCLQMNSGHSSYRLILGRNPNLRSVLVDKSSALEGSANSERFFQHLNALHYPYQAFIQVESSERIRRALHHQIRASSQTFETSDSVL